MDLKVSLIAALLTACAYSPIASAAAPNAAWQFDVFLDGKPIGFHAFELRQEGEQKVLTTEASFDVKFLFITAFRYRHQNTEIWNEDCLLSIDAVTDSNGKELLVKGDVTDGGFNLQKTGGTSELPSCVQTFAYWNPAVLEATQLLNSQTGSFERSSACSVTNADAVPSQSPM